MGGAFAAARICVRAACGTRLPRTAAVENGAGMYIFNEGGLLFVSGVDVVAESHLDQRAGKNGVGKKLMRCFSQERPLPGGKALMV